MNAQEALSIQVDKIGALCRETGDEDTAVPVADWEGTYKQLRGIKGMWDTGGTVSWEVVEKETGAEWIKIARNDPKFKQYYMLRREADRLEVLCK
jgi:hypothetical protein